MIEVKSNDLYRMKGVLSIKDFDKRFVFQVGVSLCFLPAVVSMNSIHE